MYQCPLQRTSHFYGVPFSKTNWIASINVLYSGRLISTIIYNAKNSGYYIVSMSFTADVSFLHPKNPIVEFLIKGYQCPLQRTSHFYFSIRFSRRMSSIMVSMSFTADVSFLRKLHRLRLRWRKKSINVLYSGRLISTLALIFSFIYAPFQAHFSRYFSDNFTYEKFDCTFWDTGYNICISQQKEDINMHFGEKTRSLQNSQNMPQTTLQKYLIR